MPPNRIEASVVRGQMCSSSHGEVSSHCLPFRHPCHLLYCLWLPRHQVFSLLCTIKEALMSVLWGEDASGGMLSAKLSTLPFKRRINPGCMLSEWALYSVAQISDGYFLTFVLLSSVPRQRKERTPSWACILHGLHFLPVAAILRGHCIPSPALELHGVVSPTWILTHSSIL